MSFPHCLWQATGELVCPKVEKFAKKCPTLPSGLYTTYWKDMTEDQIDVKNATKIKLTMDDDGCNGTYYIMPNTTQAYKLTYDFTKGYYVDSYNNNGTYNPDNSKITWTFEGRTGIWHLMTRLVQSHLINAARNDSRLKGLLDKWMDDRNNSGKYPDFLKNLNEATAKNEKAKSYLDKAIATLGQIIQNK